MSNEIYQKYLAKMRFGCEQLHFVIKALSQTSQVNTKEDIDARIEAATRAISYLQDIRRNMLYFKNRMGG
jgi:hypothetical protein